MTANEPSSQVPPLPPTPEQPLPILLVEDNLAHAELVRRSLENHHISNRIYHVSDGKAALDYLYREGPYADAQASPRPHMILLDLRLPKMSGLEVLQEIKTSDDLSLIPVVILTPSGATHDIATAYKMQANGYVIKPVDFAQFMQLMDAVGWYWLAWNQTPWPTAA